MSILPRVRILLGLTGTVPRQLSGNRANTRNTFPLLCPNHPLSGRSWLMCPRCMLLEADHQAAVLQICFGTPGTWHHSNYHSTVWATPFHLSGAATACFSPPHACASFQRTASYCGRTCVQRTFEPVYEVCLCIKLNTPVCARRWANSPEAC